MSEWDRGREREKTHPFGEATRVEVMGAVASLFCVGTGYTHTCSRYTHALTHTYTHTHTQTHTLTYTHVVDTHTHGVDTHTHSYTHTQTHME